MDISFIVVNYKSESFLKNCLLSIGQNLNNSSFKIEIIIVNNDKTDLKELHNIDLPNLQIINHGINDGFAKACNIGTKLATGNVYFFLNPDTELKKFDAKKLLSALEDNRISIAAPRLILPDGTVQPWSCGYSTSLLDIIKNNFGIIKSKRLWTRNTVSEVDWVSGCALAIKKSVFEKVSGFDENFFMYFEDVDLCKRTKSLGEKIIVLPEMQILHFGGQSSACTKQQKRQYYASQDYYFKKHFGTIDLFLLKLFRNFALFFKK